jgi:hypothetical protein
MMMDEREIDLLNFYRASELHGGLVLGQLAQRVCDPYLFGQLARHAAEEVVHAELWARTIADVGGELRPVRRTYQVRYGERVGPIRSLFQVLALTQVFERRVYRHFLGHARRPGTPAAVRATLLRMVDEEKDHLCWVKEWLDAQEARRGDAVRDTLERYAAIDAEIYRELIAEYGLRFRFGAAARGAAEDAA